MDGFIPSFPFQNSERSAKEPGRDRQALWEVRICKVQEASRSKGYSVLRRKKKNLYVLNQGYSLWKAQCYNPGFLILTLAVT